jgi:hypothetical protein
MQTLTEIVAAVVVHSSAVAYSHFGVMLDAKPTEQPAPAERTVARSVLPKTSAKVSSKLVVRPAAASNPLCDEQLQRRASVASA